MIPAINTQKTFAQPAFKALQKVDFAYYKKSDKYRECYDKTITAVALSKYIQQENQGEQSFVVTYTAKEVLAPVSRQKVDLVKNLFFLSGQELEIFRIKNMLGEKVAEEYLNSATDSVTFHPELGIPIEEQIKVVKEPELHLENSYS